MKNRIGKPQFIVRLNDKEEKTVLHLANLFAKDSYAKTLIVVAMNYKSDMERFAAMNTDLKNNNKILEQQLRESQKLNTSLSSKMNRFVVLVDKISDIKKELQIFRNRSPRNKK